MEETLLYEELGGSEVVAFEGLETVVEVDFGRALSEPVPKLSEETWWRSWDSVELLCDSSPGMMSFSSCWPWKLYRMSG